MEAIGREHPELQEAIAFALEEVSRAAPSHPVRYFASKLLEHKRIHGYGTKIPMEEASEPTASPLKASRRMSMSEALEHELSREDEEIAKIRARRGKRRENVFAEAVEPDPNFKPRVIPKSTEEKNSIYEIASKNFLFASCDDEQVDTLIDAMERKEFSKGEEIIKQGDMGDNFYVLASGTCDIFKDGNLVLQVSQGMGFGELALLYDSPRAASVVATSDCLTWAIDRVTFKQLMIGTTLQKRQTYESFLAHVPILSTLTSEERLNLADALQPQKFSKGTDVVREGDPEADRFYIVEDGELKGTMQGVDGEVCPRLQRGAYFGERALLKDEPRAATITAVVDSKCLVIDRAAFVRLLGPINDVLARNMDLYSQYLEENEQNEQTESGKED